MPNPRPKDGETLTASDVPVPVKLTVCGLPLALSETARVAVRVPVAVGVNVTTIVQLQLTASDVPQLFVWAKSPLLVPVIAILEMVRLTLPVFESVTVWGVATPTVWALNVSEVGESAATGAVPVPDSEIIVTAPVRDPVTVGLNVTLTEQFPPAATLAPQLFVWAKSPLAAMLEMVRAALPVLVSVTAWAVLVVPTG